MQVTSILAFFLILLSILQRFSPVLGSSNEMEHPAILSEERTSLPNPNAQKIHVEVKNGNSKSGAMEIGKLKAQHSALKEAIYDLQQTVKEMQNQITNLASKRVDTEIESFDSCEQVIGNSCLNEGIYLLNITNSGLQAFNVSCQCYGNEIWTIIQRRKDGSVDFNRGWLDYRNGFGNLQGDFWLGLEKMHRMTKRHPYELGIWLEARNGTKYFARHRKFYIADEAEKYKLTVDDYTGDAMDRMWQHDGMKFSTRDSDNDRRDNSSCAETYKAGWWFNDCGLADLNGLFNKDQSAKEGIYWYPVDVSMKYSQMAMRRVYLD